MLPLAFLEGVIAKSMADKSTSLLRLVQERALSKKEAEEEKKNCMPYIPKDCISNILVHLPLGSLQRSRFVCKRWYEIVNSSVFINAHLSRSENVLIFLTEVMQGRSYSSSMASIPQKKPTTFSVEAKLFQLGSLPMFLQPPLQQGSVFHLQFMEIKDGKCKIGDLNATCLGQIRASYNGLVLLENKLKIGGLVVMNPMTRRLITLPLGTLYPPHDESYGLALCNFTNQYKLVHLFRDELLFVSCEILNIGTESWRVVDGPPFGLFTWFGYNPVSAAGALHWVPHIDHSEYIVSMSMDDEKFCKVPLPRSCRIRDRIIEMGGLLCFVTHKEEVNQMDVWVLRSLCGEGWTKQHSITIGCIEDMVPVYCTRINGDMIFKSGDSLYAYDFQLEAMKMVEMKKGSFSDRSCCMPHVNSLVSW